MRLTRVQMFLLGGLFLTIMGPLAFTQPGPDGGKKDKKGGFGGFKMPDPGEIFAKISGGKDSFDVKTIQLQSGGWGPTPEQQKEAMMTFLQKKGVTDGTMSKANYVEHFNERMTEMRAKRGDKGKRAEDKQPEGTAPTPVAVPAAPSPDLEAQARESFALLDTDKNGSLSVEELKANGKRGQRLLDDLAKWDTNKNGTIELPEYVEFYKTHNQGKSGLNPPGAPVDPAKPVEEDKRPIVYRTGKMPKELPAWFEEADKDKDGQVGLYEWKASGKSVSEFMAMDQNGDGFLTVEEVLRYQRATTKVIESPSVGSPTPTGSSTTPSTNDASNGKSRDGSGKGKNRRPRGG